MDVQALFAPDNWGPTRGEGAWRGGELQERRRTCSAGASVGRNMLHGARRPTLAARGRRTRQRPFARGPRGPPPWPEPRRQRSEVPHRRLTGAPVQERPARRWHTKAASSDPVVLRAGAVVCRARSVKMRGTMRGTMSRLYFRSSEPCTGTHFD